MSNIPEGLKLDLTTDQLAAMGAVALEASKLDLFLFLLIEKIANAGGSSSIALRVLSERTGITKKRNQILTICTEFGLSGTKFDADMKALMRRVYKHAKKRNDLLHSTAESGEQGVAWFFTGRTDTRTGIELNAHTFTAKEIWQIAKDFQTLNRDVAAIARRIDTEVFRRQQT